LLGTERPGSAISCPRDSTSICILRIIRFEARVVKALHPLTAISPQIDVSPECRVRLEHVVAGAGSTGEANGARVIAPALALDAAVAVYRALAAPLNFPPLAQSVVPGDRLAIAVDETTPCLAGLVRGTVDAAIEAGIESADLSIVAVDAATIELLRAELRPAASGDIQFVTHDPSDANNLCFAGKLIKEERLMINRAIFDADVVLPIGCARLPNDFSGALFQSLFPRFSDAATIARFRTPARLESVGGQASARRRIEEAGWQLGVPLVIEVVPGGGGTIAEVVAGEPRAVGTYYAQKCEELWSFRAAERASLVVASVTGGAGEQTWGNIGRALAVAERIVDEGGAVAICSDLEAPPGKALSELIGNTNWQKLEKAVHHESAPDSLTAWHLLRALQRGPVYFLSELDDELVEDMGLAPIASLDQLARLVRQHASCIIIDDAQYAVAKVADEG
jgi:nickel-dependent lactate racemase